MAQRIKVKDRVKETSATTGSGDYTLGGAVASFLAFSTEYADQDLVPYYAELDSAFEVGIGKYVSATDTLVRVTILRSSNANAAVSWGSGDKIIGVAPLSLFAGMISMAHNVTTTDPAVTDDSGDFYDALSLWLNTSNSQLRICLDPSTGASRWGYIPVSDETNAQAGTRAVALGGNGHNASGSTSVVLGGVGNRATGDKSSVISGNNNQSNGGSCAILGGDNGAISATSYASIITGGVGNFVDASYAGNIGGTGNVVYGNYSVALAGKSNYVAATAKSVTIAGNYAKADHATSDVLGGSYDLTTLGRNQTERLCLGLETTDATPTAMVIDGDNAQHVTIPANGCWYVEAHVVAASGSGATVSAWKLACLIRRNGSGTPAIVGSVTGGTAFAQDAGAASWAADLAADTGNNALSISVTGQAATTIQWTATAYITQVTD